ncbi:MAG: histidine kinase dimerization/phosphoacceptor domain -containing protein [Pseudomonadota bacterium]
MIKKYIALLASLIFAAALAPLSASAQTCDEWIEIRPKGNWQNETALSEDTRRASKTCIDELSASSAEDQLALLDRYLLSAVNMINPDDLLDAADEWSDAARLKVHAVRVPFIFSPFLPDGDQIATWLQEARRIADDKALSRFAFYQALYLFRQPEAAETAEERDALLLEAADAGERGGNMRIGFFALNMLAGNARQEGDITTAVQLYRRLVTGTQQDRLALVHITALSNLAYLFYEIGDYDRAVSLYDRAINYTDRHPLTRAQAQLNRGLALAAMGNMPAAEASMKAGLDAFDENIDQGSTESSLLPARHNAAFELARFRYKQGKGDPLATLATAETSAEKLLETNYFTPSVPAEAFAWLAEQYLVQDDLAKAQSLLARAEAAIQMEIDPENINPSDQDRAFLLSFLKTTSGVLRRLGEHEDAARYGLAALALSEQRYEREKLNAVGNANLLFEIEEQEAAAKAMAQAAEISDLQRQKAEANAALATASRNRNRIAAALGIILALGALVLALALFRAYRAQKAVAKAKETFFKEMHHRVSNNLQLLLSLFRIDARRMTSGQQNLSASNENAVLRLNTMALIHDKLRALESGTTIDAKTFFEDLVSLMADAIAKPDVELEGHFAHASIDTDTAIPLGLLVSELVMNAYKHAFSDSGGKIIIKFEVDGPVGSMCVSDDGFGMTTTHRDGGLGTHLVKDLAEQLGGELQVSSHSNGDRPGTVWTLKGVSLRTNENQPDSTHEKSKDLAMPARN